jgi:hypothetical protein
MPSVLSSDAARFIVRQRKTAKIVGDKETVK